MDWTNNMPHKTLKALGIIAILVLLTGVAQASDWPVFHHDARHTGYTDESIPDDLELLWSYKTGGIGGSSPAVVNDKVFVGSMDNKIYCLDENTGNLIWNYETGSDVYYSPTVANGKVFVGSGDREIYCLDENAGNLIWSYKMGDVVSSSPTVANGKVFVGSYDREIYCLDENTGNLIWSYTTGGFHVSSPAVANGKVFVGSWDRKIYCLDENNGNLIWSYETGDCVYSPSPAAVDGKVFVGSDDEKIYCLNEDTGKLIWSYKTGGSVRSSPAVADGKVFVVSLDRKIYCLDENNGNLIWSYETGSGLSSPAVADGKVFVGSSDYNKIYCLGADTGSVIWSYETGASVHSSPAVADGKVFVGSSDGKIYCFGAKSTPTPAPTVPPTAAPTTPRPAPATAYPTPAPIAYPTPVPTSPNLQISVTPNPEEAGKTVTIRVKDNGWGVEGANVYYAKSIDAIKTGRDVVINGAYIGTTSEGGWLSYTFDKSGVYAIGVTYNRLYNPSIEHLTITAPTPTPVAIPMPTTSPVPTPTPPPVLPISPEYLYAIPIALFLILLPFIFYARRKRRKATTTPEISPPSSEQREEQISPPISEPITIERAIYDPCKRDFVEGRLPRMKEWINRYDKGAYWFAVSIQNNTDKAIEEWGVELETSSALKVEEAKIEGIEIEIPHEAHLGAFKISVPKEYGIVIPKGGAQRIYFKLRAEKPKTTYEISGVFKSIMGDVPIKAKEFKYLCDTGVSPEAVKAELKKTFSEKDATRLALSFKTVQEIDRLCNTDTKTAEYLDKLSSLKGYTAGFSDTFSNQLAEFSRFMEQEQLDYLDDEYKVKVRRFCTNLVDVWISEFLKG